MTVLPFAHAGLSSGKAHNDRLPIQWASEDYQWPSGLELKGHYFTNQQNNKGQRICSSLWCWYLAPKWLSLHWNRLAAVCTFPVIHSNFGTGKKNKNAKNCLGSTVGQWHLGHFPHSPAGTAPAPSGSSSATSLLSKGKGKSCVSSVRRMQKLTSESRGRPLLHFKEDHSHICRSNQIFKYTLLIVRDELTQTAEQRIYLANFTLAWDLSH